MVGYPILRALGEGWDTTALHPKLFPASSAYPTLRQQREGWGTRALVVTEKRKKWIFEGALPRLAYPTYADANVGHPDRVGVR
jgi:hypothetical protein